MVRGARFPCLPFWHFHQLGNGYYCPYLITRFEGWVGCNGDPNAELDAIDWKICASCSRMAASTMWNCPGVSASLRPPACRRVKSGSRISGIIKGYRALAQHARCWVSLWVAFCLIGLAAQSECGIKASREGQDVEHGRAPGWCGETISCSLRGQGLLTSRTFVIEQV